MRLSFVLIIFSNFLFLHADFFSFECSGKTVGLVFTYLTDNKKDPLHYYGEAVFGLPKFLEYAREKKLPVILVVPENLKGYSPLDQDAPLYEGARVALAWGSAYFRFKELGNVDVRVLLYDKQLTEGMHFLNKISALFEQSFSDIKTSPEEQMRERMVNSSFGGRKLLHLYNRLASFDIKRFIFQEKAKLIEHQLPALAERQKRFVITGGAGFIGTHLVERLLKEGNQVIVLDNGLCCDPQNFNRLAQYKNCFLVRHDVTLPFSIKGPVDWVIHLASVPSPEFYYNLPLETLKTGLNATRNAMNLALEKKAQFLFSSTSEVYGDPEIHPQPESYVGNVNPIGKRSQYDQSKRGAETLIKLYVDRYKLDARMVRIFNTYGPYMRLHDGRVVTNFIEATLKNKPFIIYGDGMQTRSLGYVADTVDCIVRLIKYKFEPNVPLKQKVFNAGNEVEMSIKQLAEMVQEIVQQKLNKTISINYIPQPDSSDPMRRCPDLTRSKRILGYEPQTAPHAGLEKTFDYFLK